MEMNFQNFDCAIFSAGSKASKETVLPFMHENMFIIAADAGYKACESYSVVPNLYLGDYDSASVPKTNKELICLNPIKDETDSAYALNVAVERGYKNIVMFGATGGRIDHAFANLELCGQARRKDVRLTLIDDHHKIFCVYNETVTLSAKNQYVSIFPFGSSCVLTLKGFDYPLDHKELPVLCGLGVSNEIHEEFASIQAENGMVLVIIADKD